MWYVSGRKENAQRRRLRRKTSNSEKNYIFVFRSRLPRPCFDHLDRLDNLESAQQNQNGLTKMKVSYFEKLFFREFCRKYFFDETGSRGAKFTIIKHEFITSHIFHGSFKVLIKI